MAIISFYGRKIIFGHMIRCNWTCLLLMVFVGFFGGKWYNLALFEATKDKNIDFTALNAGIWWEKKNYFCTHLYHRDHADRLFPAIYVGAKINQYIFFTFGPLFGSKSGSCCDPYGSAGSTGEAEEGGKKWMRGKCQVVLGVGGRRSAGVRRRGPVDSRIEDAVWILDAEN